MELHMTPQSRQNLPVASDTYRSHWPLSKLWPICALIIALICIGIGGGILGVYNSCLEDPDTSYADCTGLHGRGIAVLSIGLIIWIAFWIILFLYFRRRPQSSSSVVLGSVSGNRNNTVHWNLATGLLDRRNFQSTQPIIQQTQPQAVTYMAQQPNVQATEAHHIQTPAQKNPSISVQAEAQEIKKEGRCGYCGAIVKTPFCKNCGAVNTTE